MPHIIAWCGFLGAWLLVAGPLDQAVREVEDVEFEQDAIAEAMRGEDLAALFTFRDVIGAWAAGAALIAVKETWELHEAYEWSEWVFSALIVVMAVLCVASTRSRLLRRKKLPATD